MNDNDVSFIKEQEAFRALMTAMTEKHPHESVFPAWKLFQDPLMEGTPALFVRYPADKCCRLVSRAVGRSPEELASSVSDLSVYLAKCRLTLMLFDHLGKENFKIYLKNLAFSEMGGEHV